MKIKSYLRSCTLRCFAKYCLYYPAYILILNKNINKFSTSKHEVHALFIISRNTEPSQLTLKCAHSLKHNSTCPSIKTIINKIINTQQQFNNLFIRGGLTLVFVNARSTESVVELPCTSRIGRHRNSLEWCLHIVDRCTPRHQYLINHLYFIC